MAQPTLGVDHIVVLTPDPLALQIPGMLKLGNNTLDCPLGDADCDCNLTQGLLRISGKANHDMGMIGEKIPLRRISF
jgi:predicted class III extradiol MEMO1 family dioxygenase